MGRLKCGQVRAIAEQKGWLLPVPLPEDGELAQIFESQRPNPTHQSLVEPMPNRSNSGGRMGSGARPSTRPWSISSDLPGAYSSVRRSLQKLQRDQPQATCILDFAPGEAAQVDFGKGPTITDAFTGEVIKTWIFVMTLCFSRHMYAEIVTDQKLDTWLACHRRAFEWFDGVPLKVIIDNTKCAITRACFHDPEVQRSYGELAEGYGFLISPCPPRDPQKKGRVESGVKYVKNAFVPFESFAPWLTPTVSCSHGCWKRPGTASTAPPRQKPLTLFAETEKHLLRRSPMCRSELPSGARSSCTATAMSSSRRPTTPLRFHWSIESCGSRPPTATVKIYHNLELVAVHPRLQKPGARSTVDEHMPPEAIAYKHAGPPMVPASGRSDRARTAIG